MTNAKLELFDQELQEAASFFKALSHPARLAILNYLAEIKDVHHGRYFQRAAPEPHHRKSAPG